MTVKLHNLIIKMNINEFNSVLNGNPILYKRRNYELDKKVESACLRKFKASFIKYYNWFGSAILNVKFVHGNQEATLRCDLSRTKEANCNLPENQSLMFYCFEVKNLLNYSNCKKPLYDNNISSCSWYRKTYLSIFGLPSDERYSIHHLDGNRENNTLSNLVLIPNILHIKLHRSLSKFHNITKSKILINTQEYKHCRNDLEELKHLTIILKELDFWINLRKEEYTNICNETSNLDDNYQLFLNRFRG